MRQNILDRLTEDIKSARHAIVLTHNIDFVFVQTVVKAALRAIGSPKLTIFADAGCAWEAYGRQHRVIEGLGSLYRVIPVDLGPFRRFHPKAWLLANSDRAVAAIGSGNLTFGGMSANREAWAYGATDGDGADLVSALRVYLPRIAGYVKLSEPVLDDINAVFSPEAKWMAGLPAPSSVAMSPGDRPLLDQMSDNVGGDIRRVSVVTPFFDNDGEALGEIAKRFGAPVKAYVQPSRAGLSRSAAEGLPAAVSVGTAAWKEDAKSPEKEGAKAPKDAEDPKRLGRTIHAKIFAFHRDDDAVLAVGSANCSRAALTRGPTECNAEMMVVRTVPAFEASEFLGGLELTDVEPTLPENPHEEDEAEAIAAFRVVAARQTVDVVEVAFRNGPLSAVELETDDGAWPAARLEDGAASFHAVTRVRAAVLVGTTSDGRRLRSPLFWIDDEASLNAPASLRRMMDRLEDAPDGERRSDDYAAVLELFRDYLRDPESGRGSARLHKPSVKPFEYDPAAVFADGFADAMKGPGDAGPLGYSDRADAISVIAAFFRIPTATGPAREGDPPDDEDPDDPDGQVPRKPMRRPKNADNPARLRKAVQHMVEFIKSPAFSANRRPDKLGADLAFVAAIIASALSQGHLDMSAYRAATEDALQSLFFGPSGSATGAIPARVAALAPDDRNAFIADFSSARLSAALMLWISPIARIEAPEGAWFRLRAAHLQNLIPWLFNAAPPAAIYGEIVTLLAKAAPKEDPQAIVETWLRVVRSGAALKCFADTLNARRREEWLAAVKAESVDAGDILWQGNAFAIATERCLRKPKTKTKVRFLGKADVTPFVGGYLLPVRELIAECQSELPSGVAETLLGLVDECKTVTNGHDVAA